MKEIKRYYLSILKSYLEPRLEDINSSKLSFKKKAQNVNSEISIIRTKLRKDIEKFPLHEKQKRLIILQYAISVSSLEYRHAVWPYEYMALSRRVGELWERFCSAAWDSPSNLKLKRINAPSFEDVFKNIETNLLNLIKPNEVNKANEIINYIYDLVGEINMKEDEMFCIKNEPYIIDFKSGFGSNEKGNMLRLRTIGKAYKLWNPNTKLLFLVRQEENNNYLDVI